ncbi:MAG TPA: ABC transporter permease subunit [Chloroflexota bacterium]|nr:ABC transporter permease subunit [Chloroflexota bacterium]
MLTIAALTLREASRRKLLLAVGVLTLAAIILIGWGFSRIPTLPCHGGCGPATLRSVEAGLLILVAYMFSFVIAVAAPFVAAPAIAGDVESHVILSILPRPLRRSDIVLGKWLGLAVLVGGYTILTAGLQFLVVRVAVGYVPPHPVLTVLFIAGEGITLMTLALLGSTRLAPITCGIVSVILFGITWIVGIAGRVGAAFGNSVIADIGTGSSLILPTDGLWRGALFNLEPVALIATTGSSREASANPFAVASPPTTAYVIWVFIWIALVLALTVKSFAAREV